MWKPDQLLLQRQMPSRAGKERLLSPDPRGLSSSTGPGLMDRNGAETHRDLDLQYKTRWPRTALQDRLKCLQDKGQEMG